MEKIEIKLPLQIKGYIANCYSLCNVDGKIICDIYKHDFENVKELCEVINKLYDDTLKTDHIKTPEHLLEEEQRLLREGY